MKIFPYKMHISNYYTYYGIIYGIVNTINNKIYIGKTTKKFDVYLEKHFKNAIKQKNNSKYLYRAIREKQSNMVKALWEDENYGKKQIEKHKNFKQTEESKIKRSIKIKNLKWINKENVNKRVKKDELNIYLKNNWKLGRYKR